jgi:hypothetical protein
MGFGTVADAFEDDSYDYTGNDKGGGSGGSGGMTKEKRLYSFRFQVPKPEGSKYCANLVCHGKSATKRVIFPFNDKFDIYEHALWKVPNVLKIMGSFTCTCLPRTEANWTGGECPICSKNGLGNWSSSITFFPLIDMGQVENLGAGKVKLHHEFWEDKKKEKHYRRFQQALFAANRGTPKNPGMFYKFRAKFEDAINAGRLKDWSDLPGSVWHSRRNGDQASICGDDWIFIEKIPVDQIKDYLMTFGAEEEEIDLDAPLFTQLDPALMATKPGIFDYDVKEYYHKQEILAGWAQNTAPNRDYNGGGRVTGEDWGSGPRDDVPPPGDGDIPF